MELTIRISDRKSYEALLLFLQSLPAEVVVKESEKEQWNEFSMQNLAGAYAENEPEYSTIMVKEPNPLYEGR